MGRIQNKVGPAYKAMLAEARERRAQALRMVEEDEKTVTQVAAAMGVSKQRASAMINRARLERAEEPGI